MAQFWPSPPPQSGTATVSSSTLTPIPFKQPFPAPPTVVATPIGSRRQITVQNVAATGFDCIIDGSGSLPVGWVAIPAS